MRKHAGIFAILLTISGLCGCGGDSNEPERMVYAHGIGFDYQGGQYVVYVQFIDFSSMVGTSGGGLGGGSSSSSSSIVKASGRTINQAVSNLYLLMDRHVYWGHLSFVLLSERVIHHRGLKESIDLINRNYSIRYNILYYVAAGSDLEKYLTSVPINKIPISMSKLSDPDNNYLQNSYVRPKSLRELILSLDEPNHQTELPLISLKERSGLHKGQTDTDYLGVVILSENDIQGKLIYTDVYGLRWLYSGGVGRVRVILKDQERYLASVDVTGTKSRIVPAMDRTGKVRFTIDINVTAHVMTIIKPTHERTLERLLETQVRREIERTYRVSVNQHIDAFHFSEALYRSKYSAKWHRLQHNGKIDLDKLTLKKVEVHAYIKDSGKNNMMPTLD
ncbi:Ger(x)C family spore germination protein [Sporolactobacillus sp. KGMB 08714]|uniref:Ger(x)C family spore germination protein n=1 Tax=Sporolactobacillus sp. KGMB 08714 TaxID=3064704 RepID=UPI002FBE53BD